MFSDEACAQSRGAHHAGGAKGGRRELAVVGEGAGAAGEGDGEEALVETVLQLREGNLVGVAAERRLEGARDVVHHDKAAGEGKGEGAGERGVVDVGGGGARRERGKHEQQQRRALHPRKRRRRLDGSPARQRGSRRCSMRARSLLARE